jgi:DNA polymerase-3 subunit delta'
LQHYNNNKNIAFDRQLGELLGAGFDRLPHAMLLVGAEGLGKAAFGESLAHLLLCESPNNHAACGECQACRWMGGGNHPDFRHVKPGSEDEDEEGGREKAKKRSPGIIRIDQIRELESFVFVGSHRMGRRVVLLTEAEAMNNAAANALLKILEEPPPSVYFILTSSRQRFLLPTIRSRCRIQAFSAPEPAVAQQVLAHAGLDSKDGRFLDLAGGAPLRVLKWNASGTLKPLEALIDTLLTPSSDPLNLAARWDGLLKSEPTFGLEQLVEEVQRWLFDLAQDRMGGRRRYHTGWPRPKSPSGMLDPVALLGAWQELMQFRRSARHPLNQLLFLESMAAHFVRGMRPGAT